MIVLRIFIFLYGALTVLAVGEELRADGFKFPHLFYNLFGGILLFVGFRPDNLILMLIGMIGLLLFIIIYSAQTQTLNRKHILVRTIVTAVVIFLWQNLGYNKKAPSHLGLFIQTWSNFQFLNHFNQWSNRTSV